MWPMIDAVKRMKVTSWRIQESSRPVCPKASGYQSTTPEATSASAARAEVKKKIFWPPLYLPTCESSVSAFMYKNSRGPIQAQSSLVSPISFTQWANIATDEAKNTIPTQGCSQRQTARPPTKNAIQPKIGVQIGRPVIKLSSIETATVQWMIRERSRCRMISSPTTTSSTWRALITAVSIVWGAEPKGARVEISRIESAFL